MGVARATKPLAACLVIRLAWPRLAKDFVDHIAKMETNYKTLMDVQMKGADGPPSQACYSCVASMGAGRQEATGKDLRGKHSGRHDCAQPDRKSTAWYVCMWVSGRRTVKPAPKPKAAGAKARGKKVALKDRKRKAIEEPDEEEEDELDEEEEDDEEEEEEVEVKPAPKKKAKPAPAAVKPKPKPKGKSRGKK